MPATPRKLRSTAVTGASLFSFARQRWNDFASLTYPCDCAACGVMLTDGRSPVCLDCEEQIATAAAMPCCGTCAAPLPDAAGPCGRCKGKGLRPFAAIARLTPFDVAATRELVHAVKYGHRWPIADWLGWQMLQSPRVAAILEQTDVIVPVPLHWRRQFGRGFNQAELLARALAGPRRRIVACVLRRTRATTSQTAFHSRAARRRNLARAFRVRHPSLLDGMRIAIVDDVMTSGATLQAAARAILAVCKPARLSAVVVGAANPLRSDLAAT